MDIKEMSNRDLKYGIDRCNARLARDNANGIHGQGTMPSGVGAI